MRIPLAVNYQAASELPELSSESWMTSSGFWEKASIQAEREVGGGSLSELGQRLSPGKVSLCQGRKYPGVRDLSV